MTRALVVALLLAAAAAPAAAAADAAADDDDDDPPREQRYGTQILIADLVAWAAVLPYLTTRDRAYGDLAVIGLLTYLHVPPAIHAIHGNWGEAILDYLPLRFAAPYLAVEVAGCGFGGGSGSCDHRDRGIVATLATVVAVQAFDALVLAKNRHERRTGQYLLPSSSGVTLHWAF